MNILLRLVNLPLLIDGCPCSNDTDGPFKLKFRAVEASGVASCVRGFWGRLLWSRAGCRIWLRVASHACPNGLEYLVRVMTIKSVS